MARDGEPSDPPSAGAARPSAHLRAAAGLVGLESLVVLGLAVSELVSLDADRPSVGVTTAVFFALYTAGLALAARGLWRLRSWSRGPVVLAQLIQLGVASSFFGRDTTWLAVLIAVPAVVVLAVVFHPSTTDALYGTDTSTS